MELLYSMRRKPLKCEPPQFENPLDTEVVRPICTISTANIIAFSSPTELTDVMGDTWAGHVYVCDLETPWDSYKVTSTSHPVSALEWDNEGKQLLVATTAGDVSVFGQKEYLLNEWTCLYSANFPGEHIIKAAFFHNGRRVVAVEKKPDAPIADRFQMMRSTPTLKGFGGVACEGAAIVTATGLVGALVPTAADAGRAAVVTESLRPTRDYITCATIAHKNGNLLIACVCRLARGWCVRVCVCGVTRAPPPRPAPPAPPRLAVQPLPALYLPVQDVSPPVSITWCLREDPDSLLIAGSTLALWKLTERSHPVHKLLCKTPLQGSTTPGGGQKAGGDCFNTVVWQQVAVWPVEGTAAATASSKLPLAPPPPRSRAQHAKVWQQVAVWPVEGTAAATASSKLPLAPPHAALAAPNALKLLSRENHHYVCTRPVITSGTGAAEVPAGAGTPPKKPKYGPGVLPSGAACAIVSCVDISYLGGVCVCVDTHAQLHVYSLPLHTEIPTPMAHATHACNLLEYSMVSGYDCLDLLMTLKPALVEPVYERFTENFQRQPPSFQQYYYHSWLKLRIALCRASAPLAPSAAWLTCVQMCHAACAAAAAALRADALADAAALAHLLDEPHAHDQEKTLLALEAKPESCGDVSSLSSLRRPLQRALDVALTALLALPHAPHHKGHGYEIWSDPSAISLLRKLVVLARAHGCGGEALSRPLARLQAAGPKHDLQEECLTLGATLAAPRAWEGGARGGVTAPHGRPAPLFLEYGVEPESLRYAPDPPYTHCDTTPTLAMDSIRYMYLGGGQRPAAWRRCGRCGARALPAAQPARGALQRAHDARFMLACRCGGKWSLFSNI